MLSLPNMCINYIESASPVPFHFDESTSPREQKIMTLSCGELNFERFVGHVRSEE